MNNPKGLKDKAALAATVLLCVTVAGPLMWGAVSTDAIAAPPTTYTFDTCEEGWKVTENAPAPQGSSGWVRSRPGSPAAPNGMAFRSFPYPEGDAAGAPGGVYEASVTSPTHAHAGGQLKVNYFLQHDLELDFDYLFFEWSRDGKTWAEAEKWTDLNADFPTFTAIETTITAPAGSILFRFRLTSDPFVSGNTQVAGQVAFDEVTVPFDRPVGAVCGTPTGTPTQTSTASQSPTATPSQTPTATPSPSPKPSKCTKSGSNKGETLRGSSRADVICGKGGNDRIYGKGGNDVLKGQGGKDLLVGGPGRDTCVGGPGKDRFKSCEKKRQ